MPNESPRRASQRRYVDEEDDVTLPLTSTVAVTFGYAVVRRDGLVVHQDSSDDVGFTLVADWEVAAILDPDHDWVIELHSVLATRVYRRVAPKRWVRVRFPGSSE